MHAIKNHCLSYLIKPPWKKKKDKTYKILMTWGSILLLSLSLSLSPFEELKLYRITKSKEEQVKLDRNALSCRVIQACLWGNFFWLLPCSLLLTGKSSTVSPSPPQMSVRIGESASMSMCLGLCLKRLCAFPFLSRSFLWPAARSRNYNGEDLKGQLRIWRKGDGVWWAHWEEELKEEDLGDQRRGMEVFLALFMIVVSLSPFLSVWRTNHFKAFLHYTYVCTWSMKEDEGDPKTWEQEMCS